MNPLVSFVIPIYNAEKFLAETIESILNCGYEPIEIVLADDGSTDSSLEICRSFEEKSSNIRIIRHDNGINKGVSTTRKKGILEVKGEYVYFLDADDMLLPGVISQYITIFSQNSDVVLIHGEVQEINTPSGSQKLEQGFVIGLSNRKYSLAEEPYYLKSNRICNSTVCVRKEALSVINFNYKQIFPIGEDWVLWTLLAQKGYFYYFARPVIKYRIHENSATSLAIKKGPVYLQYNLMENYLCLMAKAKDNVLREKIKENIFDLINELYLSYQDNPNTESNKAGVDNQVISRDQHILSLKKKIYNLEKGYGYYFYFIYIVKNFFSKLFQRK